MDVSRFSSSVRFNDLRGDKKVRGWLWSGLRMVTIEWPLAWILGYAGNTLGKIRIKYQMMTQIKDS